MQSVWAARESCAIFFFQHFLCITVQRRAGRLSPTSKSSRHHRRKRVCVPCMPVVYIYIYIYIVFQCPANIWQGDVWGILVHMCIQDFFLNVARWDAVRVLLERVTTLTTIVLITPLQSSASFFPIVFAATYNVINWIQKLHLILNCAAR